MGVRRKHRAKVKYAADFETTTNPTDCRVWSWMVVEIGNHSNTARGKNIESFIEFAEKSQGMFYFHNLKFDIAFVENYLLNKGYICDNRRTINGEREKRRVKERSFESIRNTTNQVYGFTVTMGYNGENKLGYGFKDSLKLLSSSLKDVAESFKLRVSKGVIDYEMERPEGYEPTEAEWEYLKTDIEILALAMEIMFEKGMDKTTISSCALSQYKKTLKKGYYERFFPVLNNEMEWDVKEDRIKTYDDFIRKSYRGGFTWANDKFIDKWVGEGKVYDVNSLYPSRMYVDDLPIGTPKEFIGEYKHDSAYPLYIQAVKCQFELKEGYIPTIQLKKNNQFSPTEYLKSSKGEVVTLFVTNVDWELIKEHYHLVEVEFIKGLKFGRRNNLFIEYIEYWTEVKKTSEGAMRQIAKLMLNSLYGKFATSRIKTNLVSVLNEDGTTKHKVPVDENGKSIEDLGNPIYTAMSVFITSYSRDYTIRTAQKCYDRAIYCDTDSLHVLGLDIPDAIADVIHPKDLGKWKHEYDFEKAKYIRAKTYVTKQYGNYVENSDGVKIFKESEKRENSETKLKVVVAGMTEEIREFITEENFKVGFTTENFITAEGKEVKKLAQKLVPGGCVLEKKDFTIK